MSDNLSKRSSMKELAEFLVQMNNQSEHHVGYCSDSFEEIYHSLTSEANIGETFGIAYHEDRIVGAIGLDIDEEDQNAEVWGPFVEQHDKLIANQLWEDVLKTCGTTINTFHFFLNEKNQMAQDFALSNHATKKGDHIILVANKNEFVPQEVVGVISYHPKYKTAFQTLHDQSFPNTYYRSDEILRRIEATNQLFLLPDGDAQIKGYVYIEASPEHGVGSIEYIAVSDNHRRLGIGTQLIEYALSILFSYPEILEITITVGKENETAIRLYEAAGFEVKHQLTHYVIKR